MKKTFTLYWRTGDRQIVEGATIADAMTSAGYGGGAVRALDFFANGNNEDYVWNKEAREWEWTPEHAEKVMRGDA